MFYETANGERLSDHPTTPDEARKHRKTQWRDFEHPCDRCGQVEPVRWVDYPEAPCFRCIMQTYIESLQHLPQGDYVIKAKPCKRGPHLFIHLGDGRKCIICEQLKTPPTADAIMGLSAPGIHATCFTHGYQWYVPSTPCHRCNTIAPRHVSDPDQCSGCHSTPPVRTPSPWKLAKDAGERWYTPTEACSQCRVVAPKYVANGRCKACDQLDEGDRAVMSEGLCPLEAAVAIGVKVYTRPDGTWVWR